MSFPPRPPLVPYGIAPGVVTMQMPTHVMVGAYSASGAGGGRGALLPAPPPGKAVISRGPTRNANGAKDPEGPAVTVFIGNISSRAPDAMIRSLLGACGPVLSWKRVSTFGFSEFASPEAALRCVRLLNSRPVADKQLLAKTDGKMQALVDTYKTEQRSRLGQEEGAPGTEGEASYLDARQRALDEAAERRLQQIMRDYQDDINNYELLQKEEAISKTARVLEEADISEEKRDVIHREIGKFRESMKVRSHPRHAPAPSPILSCPIPKPTSSPTQPTSCPNSTNIVTKLIPSHFQTQPIPFPNSAHPIPKLSPSHSQTQPNPFPNSADPIPELRPSHSQTQPIPFPNSAHVIPLTFLAP
uniref:SFRICE_028579 n=1 Tax=Spodoptera frugiperda TaxID=7108 RepID=A0A2H1WG59_SPOFR